jgi:trk system potassium uptake protein
LAKERPNSEGRVVVLGLGRFGVSLARELVRRGVDVLGIDDDAAVVQHYADELTHAAVADTTDEDALRQLDVHTAARAVVGIGTNLEASILTTSVLVDFEIPHIWAKATSRQQGRILERIGAHHIVLPEHEMGVRIAHQVTGRMQDFIRFEDDFAMAKTVVPDWLAGVPLGRSRLRSKEHITVVGIKKPGTAFTYATAETVADHGDVIIVSGRLDDVEEFADHL